jgi:hypothetical protein
MSDAIGLFEHAEGTTPRPEHGYCTDDNARLLVVACRERAPSREVRQLVRTSLRFLADAQGIDGRTRNRRDVRGRWTDRHGVEDNWGRTLWGFGTAVAAHPSDSVRQEALARFERGVGQRSPWPHAMTFAGLGAIEVLRAHPDHRRARSLLRDAVAAVGVDRAPSGERATGADPAWPWPELRLSYANGALAELCIAGGIVLDRRELTGHGLALLAWLLASETIDGHLSVTPVDGRGPTDARPGFDQQPIEVAAIADACATAAAVTGEPRWVEGLAAAVDWFLGANDSRCVMWDASSGGAYDGLTPTGPNLNQGAESTLAFVATMQHARNLVPVPA